MDDFRGEGFSQLDLTACRESGEVRLGEDDAGGRVPILARCRPPLVELLLGDLLLLAPVPHNQPCIIKVSKEEYTFVIFS